MDRENTPIEQLAAHFNRTFPLPAKEREQLDMLFAERKIKRRGFVLQQGDVCRHFSFVVKGCFKMYAIAANGKEHNLEFAAEGDWICDLSSFYSESPSQVYIEAMEPGLVLQIKRADVIYLYGQFPKFNSSFRIITERKYIELQRRLLQNISATAEERYQFFLQQYPALVNRLPAKQIASYLGITSEFLSKVRNNMAHTR